MDDRERELADAAEDLADTLEAVRKELLVPPRGPLGVPRPPTPGELLRFTEQYTIPALVSILETSIRVLELLAAAIRLADDRALDVDSERRADRLAAASRTTLRTLDDALADLQSAAAGGEPTNPEARRLLREARELRAEIDDRLAGATDSDSIDTDGSENETTTVDVDVDQELESIKRDLDETNPVTSGESEDHDEDPSDS
jgi:hypothetical protein